MLTTVFKGAERIGSSEREVFTGLFPPSFLRHPQDPDASGLGSFG